ncbi:MAG: amidase [Candidatus Marinimicrobia bacterium]|nr:amidase [Candidatus Neomarinimicrobiota bacterium]
MSRNLNIIILACIIIITGCIQRINDEKATAITTTAITKAEILIGLQFNDTKRDSMQEGLEHNLNAYENIRALNLSNSVAPALQFNPLPIGFSPVVSASKPVTLNRLQVEVPGRFEDLAFYSVRELAELIRTRKITSTELTQMYLERLKKFGPQLECVVTLTEELALDQARKMDIEIATGHYRGPLHGIPYGAKDLLAVDGYPTTWGAEPYREQIFDQDATVIKKLDDAGAVLIAKLTLGALAWGDVWFGGKTRNPWNLEQGSSGSSAGPAAATAAGLVAFSIGSETWGSIVSPSTRCGVTGLRPTYGRVSRTGAMALSWSMDKLGPICRNTTDCALVFEALYGPDGIDQTIIDLPFTYNPDIDISKLRIGYLAQDFNEDYSTRGNDQNTLQRLRDLGAELIPITLPDYPIEELAIILSAEAAAAFDELTRSGQDDQLVRQIKNAWPNEFRVSRFIPAVEYIQANRVRRILIQEMESLMKTVDVYVAPSLVGDNLLLTNLTGHPCVVVPNGFTDEGSPTSISFIGRLFDENLILAMANKYQSATDWHLRHPPQFK